MLIRYELAREALAYRRLGEEWVIAHAGRDEFHLANPMAALLLEALEQGATADELLELLAERCEEVPPHAARDLQAWLEAALAHGLLRVSPAVAPLAPREPPRRPACAPALTRRKLLYAVPALITGALFSREAHAACGKINPQIISCQLVPRSDS